MDEVNIGVAVGFGKLRATASWSALASTAATSPSGPTLRANHRVVLPVPQPMSATRPPRGMPIAVMIRIASGP
jgi:hypothetical protein